MPKPGLAVEASDLSKQYRNGVVANDKLNVAIRRGQVYGLLGPNGAGKSTFVQQVMGLIRPTSGNVWVFGVDADRDPERVKRMIGYLPQTSFAMRDLLAEEAIYFTGRLKGLSHQETLRQRDSYIEQFEVDETTAQAHQPAFRRHAADDGFHHGPARQSAAPRAR